MLLGFTMVIERFIAALARVAIERTLSEIFSSLARFYAEMKDPFGEKWAFENSENRRWIASRVAIDLLPELRVPILLQKFERKFLPWRDI